VDNPTIGNGSYQIKILHIFDWALGLVTCNFL